MSLSEKTYKPDFYISVWYIATNKTKIVKYDKQTEAENIYRRTLNKFTPLKDAIFIQLRDADHTLMQCELLNYIPITPPKRKNSRKK